MGWERSATAEAVEAMNDLYANELCVRLRLTGRNESFSALLMLQ